MTSPEPGEPQIAIPVSNGPVVLCIILAIILGIPGLIGLAAFGVVLGIWISEGFRFLGSDAEWMPLFIIPAEAFICFSVLTIGIVLRFARWKRAPVASLVLSVLSAAVLVLGYQLLLDSFPNDDAEAEFSLVASVVGLIITSAPPLLHWWNAKRKA